MELLKGKPVADAISQKTTELVGELLNKDICPTLAILRVGSNESDIAYEKNAEKKAKSLGIHVEKYIMDGDSTEDDVLDVLAVINGDPNIHGILMFRPLPKYMDEDKVRNHIEPSKDIDGISDAAVGSLFLGNAKGFPPCTAEAAMAILDYYGVEIQGKKAVVIGRSLVIGKPVAMMLLDKNATVTICHSRTTDENLKEACRNADIIIAAAGRAKTVTAEHVDGKQIIVDVGINFDEEGNMCGDVDFDGVCNNVSAITPVPGGVGGVTTALLMYHVATAAANM